MKDTLVESLESGAYITAKIRHGIKPWPILYYLYREKRYVVGVPFFPFHEGMKIDYIFLDQYPEFAVAFKWAKRRILWLRIMYWL